MLILLTLARLNLLCFVIVASHFKFRVEQQTDKASRGGSTIRKPEESAAYVLGKERGVWSVFLQRDVK